MPKPLRDDVCPYCGSDDHLSVDRPESDTNVLWCVARCENCRHEWRWFYRLEGIEPLNPGSCEET